MAIPPLIYYVLTQNKRQIEKLFVYLTPRIPNSSSSSSARPSQKPSPGDISGTESGRIYPLVSKRPEKYEKIYEKKKS